MGLGALALNCLGHRLRAGRLDIRPSFSLKHAPNPGPQGRRIDVLVRDLLAVMRVFRNGFSIARSQNLCAHGNRRVLGQHFMGREDVPRVTDGQLKLTGKSFVAC